MPFITISRLSPPYKRHIEHYRGQFFVIRKLRMTKNRPLSHSVVNILWISTNNIMINSMNLCNQELCYI